MAASRTDRRRALIGCSHPYLQDELHHLGVDQAVDRLAVHVGDQVALLEAGVVRRAALLHMLKGRGSVRVKVHAPARGSILCFKFYKTSYLKHRSSNLPTAFKALKEFRDKCF